MHHFRLFCKLKQNDYYKPKVVCFQGCWPHNNTLRSITAFCEQIEYSSLFKREARILMAMISIQKPTKVSGGKRLSFTSLIKAAKKLFEVLVYGSATVVVGSIIGEYIIEPLTQEVASESKEGESRVKMQKIKC